jgi:hypothetical protein
VASPWTSSSTGTAGSVAVQLSPSRKTDKEGTSMKKEQQANHEESIM